jgi:hypothetical protein
MSVLYPELHSGATAPLNFYPSALLRFPALPADSIPLGIAFLPFLFRLRNTRRYCTMRPSFMTGGPALFQQENQK